MSKLKNQAFFTKFGLDCLTMKSERIKQRRKELRLTQQELGKAVGVSKATISQWEAGDTSPNGENLARLAKAMRTEISWLLYGTEKPAESFSLQEEHPETLRSEFSWLEGFDPWDDDTPLRDDEVEVPLYMEVELSAGNGSSQRVETKGPKLRFAKRTLAKRNVPSDAAACVIVSGNSMEPVLPDKSVVGINSSINRIVKDGDMYAIDQGGLLRVKKVYRMPGEKLRLSSFNKEEYPDEVVETAELRVLGKVFWWSVLC